MVRVGSSPKPLTAVAVAVMTLFALDAAGPANAGDRISVRDQRDAAAGSLVVVPIEASTDSGLVSASFGLGFSTELLTPLAVYRTSLTRRFELGFDLGSPGVVSIDIRGTEPVFEAGAIVWVLFRNHGAVGDGTELSLHRARLNDADGPVVQNGRIELDAGVVTLDFPTDLTEATGETITAPLSADNAGGILAMDIRIEYDPLVLHAVSVARTPISQTFTLTPNLNTPGVILISLFGTQPMAGAGPILNFDFQVVGATGQSTPIDLVSAGINEGGIVPTLQDGFFLVCDNDDLDGDGVATCDGDCDDDDNGRFPGNPELGCDNVDQDCDALTLDVLDGDGDNFTCDSDCNDGNAALNPDADEICDGVDNDCDLGIDNVPPPVGLVHDNGIDDTSPTLSWPMVAGATGYDVLRGSLSELKASGGDFSQAAEICLGEDTPDAFIDDTDRPAINHGYWYLVRPVNCGGVGSYDGGGATQVGLRDAEADASAASCN